MLFPNTTLLPYAGVEDPFVYIDATRSVLCVCVRARVLARV